MGEIISIIISLIALYISIFTYLSSIRKKNTKEYKSGVYHFDESHEAAAIRRKSE